MPESFWSRIRSLLFFAALVAGVALLSGRFSGPNTDAMYRNLRQPAWAPPGWLFGPVWGVLYALIAAAGWRIWRAGRAREVRLSLVLWGLQLFLNGLWTLLYFQLRLPWIAFWEISLLFLITLACLLAFSRVSRLAAGFMVPYALWVGFAAALNLQLARLNFS